METTPNAAGSLRLEESCKAFQGAPLHREEPAWGLGGSWLLATLQLVGRGAGWWLGGGWGAESCSWLMGAPLPPRPHPLPQRGAQGGWQAPGLDSWEGMQSIEKARKRILPVKSLLDVGLDNPVAIVLILRIGK